MPPQPIGSPGAAVTAGCTGTTRANMAASAVRGPLVGDGIAEFAHMPIVPEVADY